MWTLLRNKLQMYPWEVIAAAIFSCVIVVMLLTSGPGGGEAI